MRWFGSSVSLKRAMRSWMSIAALTAVTAEPNSASMASPAVPTSRPLAASMAGRQTSVWADFKWRNVRVSAPSIIRVNPAKSAWTMAARRRCMMCSLPHSASTALEGGCPALLKRAQALAQVLGALAFADALTDAGNVRLGLGELLDGALHVGHRQRSQAGE